MTLQAWARSAALVFLLALGTLGVGTAPAPRRLYRASADGYLAATLDAGRTDDTLRARLTGTRPARRPTRTLFGSLVVGYFSPRGLPPMQGALTVTDTGLVFRSADGHFRTTLPVVGPVRESAAGRWRASAISLAYVDGTLGRDSYVFRVDGGVFETDVPGPLMDLAAHPSWLDNLRSREWVAEHALVDGRDARAVADLLDSVASSGYADSLYAVFGRPARAVGVVGARGRAAGRLGEYVASRDSLALDPGRMTSERQLRHTLAHELAHRWQARAAPQLAALWQGVPAIHDPKRYGYANLSEQQAEAAAFAAHFLLATGAN
ncbi:MAG TPA: hypothetical protein VFJ50_11740, partial [Gemmatimonadales bacterium]|nr:hypothetical protein [Gemmatimonadales bacterium]